MLKSDESKRPKFEPGKLIVQFKRGVAGQARTTAHTASGTREVGQIPPLNISILSVEPGTEMESRDKYLAMENVLSAEPNYYYYPDYLPRDPLYYFRIVTSEGLQRQWGLRRINPEYAWTRTRFLRPHLKIAVIDSGIDPNHPDLAGKIVDPVNLASDDPNDYIDRSGHGTFVAGIAAAVTNNRMGIAGTSFNTADIMPIRVGSGSYPLSNILNGVIYAVEHGANIIQMSFGSAAFSTVFQNLLDYAWENGAVNVASAGNAGSEQVNYPAGYYNVLAVSATDQADAIAEFSNWGSDVGITAPGVAILSTAPTYPVEGYQLSYDALDGTSFSSPFVSGVAALVMAVNRGLRNADVVRILQQSASQLQQVPSYSQRYSYLNRARLGAWNPFFGYGMLDASQAVRMALSYGRPRSGIGSFYGQVLGRETGLPVGGATVSARVANTPDRILRRYVTNNYVLTLDEDLYASGMFRLMNIPRGEYDIYVGAQRILRTNIEPGCDALLRLSA